MVIYPQYLKMVLGKRGALWKAATVYQILFFLILKECSDIFCLKCIHGPYFLFRSFIINWGKIQKILDWQVCVKRCHYCTLGKRLGRKLKHSCWRNRSDSAKAMELHMAIKKKDFNVKHIIGRCWYHNWSKGKESL